MAATKQNTQRLIIPAELTVNTQRFIMSSPWYLQTQVADALQQDTPPAMLQFRSDEFMNDFLAGVKKRANDPDAAVFEKLLAMRDYAEAPANLLDAAGNGLYPDAFQRQGKPTNDLDDDGGQPEPDWFRKLYLTLHQHFHLVALDIKVESLSCQKRGYPPLKTSRVIDSGMIVRRLVADNTRERWEDWISVNDEQGTWFEFASGAMAECNVHLDSEASSIDPTDIIPGMAICETTLLYATTGLAPDLNRPIALTTEKLTPLPAATMQGQQHTSLFGYLPLSSGQHQVAGSADLDQVVSDLKNIVTTDLQQRWFGGKESQNTSNIKDHLDNLRAAIAAGVNELLPLTTVPPRVTPVVDFTDAQGELTQNNILSMVRCMAELRKQRIAIIRAINDKLTDDLTSEPIQTATLGQLGEGIKAWLATNGTSLEQHLDVAQLSTLSNAITAHRTAVKLEDLFKDNFPVDGLVSLDELIADRQNVVSTVIDDAINAGNLSSGFRFNHSGLSFSGTLELGLLVFPAMNLSKARLDTIINTVASQYDTPHSGVDLSPKTKREEASKRLGLVRPRYDSNSLYCVQCYVRVTGRDACEQERIIWSQRSEPFSIAEPTDILGMRPVAMQLPDLKKMLRDLPRLAQAKARPFASVNIPSDSNVKVNGDEPLDDISRVSGIQTICSYGIPVFTICAWVLFSIILAVLSLIPGFTWLLRLKFCIPVPGRRR